jgi:membrane protein YdbS with pleckstrin-like domain
LRIGFDIMHAMVVRQSVKFLLLAYALCGLLEAAIAVYWQTSPDHPDVPIWVPLALPLALQVLTAIRHLGRLTTRLTIEGDHIKFESGLLSRSMRVMELAKVQDVRSEQSLGQRMVNTGNLSLETAGESSRIVMPSVDRPQYVAEQILGMARAQRQPPVSGPPPSPARGGPGLG